MTDMDLKLKYVTPEHLPSGNVRYRFRRNGRKTTLRGEPGSTEFMKHYAALIADSDLEAPVRVNAVTGSIAWATGQYLSDLEMRVGAGLASPLTLKGHRHHLARLVSAYGPKDANIPRTKIIEMHGELAHTPGAADNFLKAVSAMYKFLINRDLVHISNPTRDVSRYRKKTGGFATWNADDFKSYMNHHGPGTMARRALVLAISTTARRNDIRALGRQHEFTRDGRRWIGWTQGKAPHRRVELPMTEMLQAEVAGHTDMTYLLTQHGKPFTHGGVGQRFRSWCDEAGVSKSLHGVRKGVSALLPASGTSSLELDVLLGHEMNSDETKVYVEGAERSALAMNVINRLDAVKW